MGYTTPAWENRFQQVMAVSIEAKLVGNGSKIRNQYVTI